ncbi:hypothetical protein MVEN_00927800 [Mycena venus]|uniref:Uncharacterized protein n=1 Tax=Mycena venus TaxID=2733690 RepID=A0A8H6YCU8_9AGAR|nr:hypothetical protein MVEN_00927800 [Mycena venus]
MVNDVQLPPKTFISCPSATFTSLPPPPIFRNPTVAHNMSIAQTLSLGIQDVFALLPIFGTDQCERHIGEALESGFLDAAAAPLSILGCLGIVKAAIGILINSIDPIRNRPPYIFGQWWRKAEFKLLGSAASMIEMVDEYQYRAEANLDKFLLSFSQHSIDDSPMNIRVDKLFQWNVQMVVTTTLLSAVSGSPYVGILHDQGATFANWIYPVIRVVGSSMCAVVAQFVLQLRIKGILKKSTRKGPKTCIQRLGDRILLSVCHVLLVLGICATVVGYAGCFIIVQHSSTRDTLLWGILEGVLALLRFIIWSYGAYAKWDNIAPLKLQGKFKLLPMTTTALKYNSQIVKTHQPFKSMRDQTFLPKMGIEVEHPHPKHLRGMEDQSAPCFAARIYYTTALADPDNQAVLHLLTTIVDRQTDPATVVVGREIEPATVVVHSSSTEQVTMYSASVTRMDADDVVETRLGKELDQYSPVFNKDASKRIINTSKMFIKQLSPGKEFEYIQMSWAGVIVMKNKD